MALIQADAPSPNFFLDGNFSPVAEERDAEGMEVIGAIPKDLQGHFLRVGPNPVHVFSEEAYHTFDGDGMIHAIEFNQGTARYRNRFIENEGFKLERERGDWVYKGMNSLMDPTPSRVPEGAPPPRISPIPPSPFITRRCMPYTSRHNQQSSLYRALRRSVPLTLAADSRTRLQHTPRSTRRRAR